MVKVPVGYKLPRWLVEWLRIQDKPAAQLIEDALRKQHKLKPPTSEFTGLREKPRRSGGMMGWASVPTRKETK